MNSVRSTAGQYLHRWAVVVGVALVGTPLAQVLPSSRAQAQRTSPQIVHIIDADGGGPDFDTRTVRPRFDLFGAADAAFSGMRALGNYGTAISNYGDCDGTLRNCQNNRINSGFAAPYFEVEWVYAAPPSQYQKIRQVAPSIANATGGGWMAGYNRTVLGHPKRFGPHDGTLGRMFSGVTSTADGSCRDHTGFANGNYLAGVQILPTSDCPETWGAEGWRGAHPIDHAGWEAWLGQRGNAFTFDFWQVPPSHQRLDKRILGSHHHTYGESSDYNTLVLANYGSVVPGGVGNPVYQGYPLGLFIRFEAFNFALPSVKSAYFVQSLIVNRSEDVWGHGIDYDSLYFGFSQGTLFNTRNNSRYSVPDLGLVLYHQPDVQGPGGPCYDAARTVYPGNGCALNGGPNAGYGAGATALIFLKTPLGDQRNKLFTRTRAGAPCTTGADPFCNPAHPLAGDTFTFNRQAYGDFGGAEAVTFGTSVRAAFGYLAGDEVSTLDGRAITDLNARSQWRTFRSERWSVQADYYNKYVPPGGWDYNHDGILDTLKLDTCGRFGCAGVDSDTMSSGIPGQPGAINNRGNVGGLQSFGPFSLAAGDTTAFVYAHVGEQDSVQLWSQVHAVLDLYLGFYLTPDAPPPARIVATQVTPGTDGVHTTPPRIQFYFSDDPETWVDPYLSKVADDLDAAGPGTALGALAALNPTLSAQVRARAADNLERLEIYKSCDGGETFTADADCLGDPTVDVDGSLPGFGWRTYATYLPGAQGDVPNVFSDDNVQDGRTYLYVIVAKSRGATFTVDTPDGPEQLTFAESIRNPLSRAAADPNVALIYVPVSRPAGYTPATVDFTSRPAGTTVPFVVDPLDDVLAGAYRAVFGNELVVTRDSIPGSPISGGTVSIGRRAFVDVAGVRVDSVLGREEFAFFGPSIPVAGTGVPGTPGAALGVIHLPTVYAGIGFLLVGPDGPIFGSTTLTGPAATPPSVMGSPTFPRLTITANNSVAGASDPDAESQIRGPQSIAEQRLAPSDTVVPRDLVNSFAVQWVEQSSTRTAHGRGIYEVYWWDDPFGVARGFRLNLENPSATEAEVRAALLNRAAAAEGLTDAETALLVGVDQTALVAVRMPFTIQNLTFERPVDVAMLRRLSNRLALGSGRDTLTVTVQEDQWVPGDPLILIEDVTEDSTTATGLVLGADGTPLQRTRRAVTFSPAVLGCNSVRLSCNPVLQSTPGATGYLPMRASDRTRFGYYSGFTPTDEFAFEVVPPVTGDAIATLTDSVLARIRVVPNPFVIYSLYQTAAGEPRLLFTNVPGRGTLRIYSVAGQFVQQITWEPADLLGDGDLFWNLRTHNEQLVASGLYLWVLTTPSNQGDPASRPLTARGKLVVIQGDTR